MKSPCFNYTIPCTGGNSREFERLVKEEKIKDFLNENSSIEEVRDYFFRVHNPREYNNKNFSHLVFPYEILSLGDVIYSEIRQPFFPLSENFRFRRFSREQIETSINEMSKEISKGGIIITHAQIIVDYATSEELSKYDFLYNENPRFW